MVDFVAQNSIHRFGPPIVGSDGVTMAMDEIVLYRHHRNDIFFSAYASAKQSDIVAFGLPNGMVRVMGGVVATQFINPTGAGFVAPPLPALPRYFEYLVKTSVLKLAFSPDGTSLAILYRSCLVVQSVTNSNVKRVYYFGTEHSRIFLDMLHSDESVFLRELNGHVSRFSLVDGSFGHEVPPVLFNNVSFLWTVLESSDKLITYDETARRMKYMAPSTTTHTYEFPDGLFLGEALPADAVEPDFFLGCDEDESFFWTAGPEGVNLFRTLTGECIATYRTNVLQDTTKFQVGFRTLHAAEQIGEVVKYRKFLLNSDTCEIVVADEREVPFDGGKDLMELSRQVSLLTTRFQAARPLYVLQPLRIQDIVLNSHMFPVEEEESEGSETETGSDEDEDDDDAESNPSDSAPPAAVLAASFHFPQPLHGLQRIISLTRNCVEHADAYVNMEAWTPEEFQRVRTICNHLDVHYYPAKRLYGRALMVIADVKEVIQKIDVEIEKFVDFYGATATFGQFEFDAEDEEAGGDPYGFKREFIPPPTSADVPLTTTTAADQIDLDEFLVIPEGGRLKFMLDRVKLVEAIHDEGLIPLDAVNTGVISTLNCMKSQFKDVLRACVKCARGAKCLFKDMRVARRQRSEAARASVAVDEEASSPRKRKAE